MLARYLLRGCALATAALVTGCAAQTSGEETTQSEGAAVTADQAVDVANIYNVGVANGYILSFLSANDTANAKVSFFQQEHFWPGYGATSPDFGRSITYNGAALGSMPMHVPTTMAEGNSNMTTIQGRLQNRTPYSPYFSLGSLITSAEMQADYMVQNSPDYSTVAMQNQSAAMVNLQDAIGLAQTLCRSDGSARGNRPATTFHLSGTWNQLNEFRSHTFPRESPDQGAQFMNWIHSLRVAWGAVVANPAKLESGISGPGCD